MATTYVGPGDVVDYVNTGSAISSGDRIEMVDTGTGLLGVALDDIAATTGVGAVAITGVFTLPKVSGAVIAQGGAVFWDTSANAVDDDQATKATGDFTCGTAMEAGINGQTTLKVKLNGYATALT